MHREFQFLDSASIVNDMFHFTGSLTEPAVHAALQIKGINDFGSFWLENSAITFTAESGKLQEAVITGSKTQQEQIRFGSTVNNDTQSISFIRHHPKSIVSAYILSIYASTWGKATSALLYNHLSKKIKNTPYAEDVLEFITTNKNPKIGEKYVDFTLPNAEGKNVSLSDFKNKVVLLDFWGSWCGPCRANNPELVKIYNEFNGRGFEILGVAADLEKAQWINAIKKDGLTWENVTDLKGWNNKPALIYGINHYPTNYLIDKNGTIVAMDISSNDLRNKLREMLN